jgi:Zn-finger nucleic acid-binding protein
VGYTSNTNSLKCPKCHHGMEEATYEDITIDRCTGCGGLWFDGDEAQRLKHLPGSEVLDSGDPKKGRHYDRRADICCPRCGKPMEKSSDWKQVHIWYEVCRDHGIFMDAGEFTDFKHETLLDRFRELIKGRRKI